MRKVVAAVTLTTALVGLPAAQLVSATAPPDTVNSAVADDDDEDDDDSNTGLWGLAGLLGLVGLAGLAGRRDRHITTIAPGVPAAPPTAYGATSERDTQP
jgi:hypothetical protein